jgi:hypothetical protein
MPKITRKTCVLVENRVNSYFQLFNTLTFIKAQSFGKTVGGHHKCSQ